MTPWHVGSKRASISKVSEKYGLLPTTEVISSDPSTSLLRTALIWNKTRLTPLHSIKFWLPLPLLPLSSCFHFLLNTFPCWRCWVWAMKIPNLYRNTAEHGFVVTNVGKMRGLIELFFSSFVGRVINALQHFNASISLLEISGLRRWICLVSFVRISYFLHNKTSLSNQTKEVRCTR